MHRNGFDPSNDLAESRRPDILKQRPVVSGDCSTDTECCVTPVSVLQAPFEGPFVPAQVAGVLQVDRAFSYPGMEYPDQFVDS